MACSEVILPETNQTQQPDFNQFFISSLKWLKLKGSNNFLRSLQVISLSRSMILKVDNAWSSVEQK